MKKLFILSVFVISTGILIQAQNLIQNGDFENWKRVTAQPGSWLTNGGLNTNFLYAKDKKQGNCVQLTDSESSEVKARRFQNTTNIDIASAGTYEVSFKVKGNVGLRAVVLAKKGENPATGKQTDINHSALINGYSSGTMVENWTEVKTIIEVPKTTTFADDYRLHLMEQPSFDKTGMRLLFR